MDHQAVPHQAAVQPTNPARQSLVSGYDNPA